MSQFIASDDANPEFQGSHNPDSRLSVRFYSRPVQNMFKTESAGRPIYEDVDYVEITTPGNSLSIMDIPVRDDHKRRFALHWAHYKNNNNGKETIIGTPLSQWTLVTPAQAETLKHLQFFTVEHVANASDLQLQSLGMSVGMGGHEFRERAKSFLNSAKSSAELYEREAHLKRMEQENADLRLKLEQKNAIEEQALKALESRLVDLKVPAEETMNVISPGKDATISPEAPKRGRPLKIQ